MKKTKNFVFVFFISTVFYKKVKKNTNTLCIGCKLFVYQCRLLITLANSLDPDQARRFVGPDQIRLQTV